MSGSITDKVAFDPFEPGFNEWPYHQYARLREADPIHHSELLHAWVVTRFVDVEAILKDPSMSTDIDNATPTPNTELEREGRDGILGSEADPLPLLDPPEHTRIRRILAPSFRKGAVKGLVETIEHRLDTLIDDVIDERGPSGTFDLVADVVYPMPVMVICELMGIPDEDGEEFRHWVQMVALGLDPVLDLETRDACLAAGDEMRAYLAEQIADKRANPADDLTSSLVHATDEDGTHLTDAELIAQLQTIYIAGHEPVTAVLANGFLGFSSQQDELRRLWDDRSLVDNAVLELLRFDGPNQFVRRIAMTDLVFEGGTIPAGGVIYVGVGSANHDPSEFGEDADAIRVDRPSAVHHLQLGAGVHSCLGTHLARLEVELSLRKLLDRFSSFELAQQPEWSPRMVLRSVNDLHLNYKTT